MGLRNPVSAGLHTGQHASQAFQYHLIDVASGVPSIVDDERLSAQLRLELLKKLLHAELLHIGHMDVPDSAL